MSHSIAFFDFDGTITTKDTMIELIKYQKGNFSFYLGFLAMSPLLIAYKLKLYPNWKAKQKVLQYFFNGTPIAVFQKRCDDFASKVIPKLLRPKAMETIEFLKSKNVRIILVTASAENWVKGWCESMNIEYLATCLEIKDQKITGRIRGKNCYGPEKVERIKNYINLKNYENIYAFGDSNGDAEMLRLTENRYYRPFGPAWKPLQIMVNQVDL